MLGAHAHRNWVLGWLCLEAAAKDAPGQPPAEDIPQHHTGKPLLQRFCTRARMRLRHAGVARRMALLPHDEPLKEAFDLGIPSDFFITCTTQVLELRRPDDGRLLHGP